MPYDPRFEKALRGIAHGWKPDDKGLKRISPGKAKAMLREADTEARRRALKE